MLQSNPKLPTTPTIEVVDFTDVMCLSKGLSARTLLTPKIVTEASVSPVKTSTSKTAVTTTVEGISNEDLNTVQVNKAVVTPGIIPPKREIDFLRKYYRNQAGIKNEFQQTRILGLT